LLSFGLIAMLTPLAGSDDETVSVRVTFAKLAVSVIGPFIVTLAGLLLPANEPVPVPAHPLKANPLFANAVIVTL